MRRLLFLRVWRIENGVERGAYGSCLDLGWMDSSLVVL